MTRPIICLALLTVATRFVLAETNNTSAKGDEETIETLSNIERELARASVNLDPAPYDRYWSDDFVGVGQSGATYTKGEHRSSLASGKVKFESLDVSAINVRVFADTAVVTDTRKIKGHYEARDISAVNCVTSVFIRRDGKWQKIAEHTSRLSPPANK
jgi:hypothetical protein